MATLGYEHKPFVASEVGLKLETHMISDDYIANTGNKEIVTETDADGNERTVVKAGAVYANETLGSYGLVYNDVDITDGGKHASVMTGGYYYKANLPYPSAVSSDVKADFEAHGLFEQVFGATTRSPITDWDGANVAEEE